MKISDAHSTDQTRAEVGMAVFSLEARTRSFMRSAAKCTWAVAPFGILDQIKCPVDESPFDLGDV